MITVSRIASLSLVAALGCSSADFDTSDPLTVDDSGAQLEDALETSPATDTAHDTHVIDDAIAEHNDSMGDVGAPESSPPVDTGTTSPDTSTTIDTGSVVDVPTSSSASFLFPKSSDTRHLVEDPYMGLSGDYLEGSRTTTLSSARRFSGGFLFENDLTGGSLSLDVSINGTKVGSIGPIDATPKTSAPVSFDFSFAPIAGPTFDVRFDAHPSADRLGTIGVTFDASMVRLDE